MLGHDIEIVITDISRSGVKIGIVAPSSLTILRGEVRDAVEQANREALQSSFSVPPAAAPPAFAEPGAAAVETQPSVGSGLPQPSLSER